MKSSELPFPVKIIIQKPYCICGGITVISATIKDFKDTRVVVPTSLFNSSLGLCKRKMGLEE